MTRFKSIFTLIFLILTFYVAGFYVLSIVPDIEFTQESLESTATPVVHQIDESDLYQVLRVVDGDTFDVDVDGEVVRIRFIGMDAPESVHPSTPLECYGNESSLKLKELIEGKSVALEIDETQQERDYYGRLLRHVFLEDGTNVGELMIREGYAHEYTYSKPYIYQQEFREAQQYAQETGAGFWGDGVCK